MNLILAILRLVLSVLFPYWQDGLSLAARSDGRLEQHPRRNWQWLFGEKHGGGILPTRPPRAKRSGAAPPRRQAPSATDEGGD